MNYFRLYFYVENSVHEKMIFVKVKKQDFNTIYSKV